MPKLPSLVVGLEVEAIAHATEDLERVTKAVMNVLPAQARGRVKVKVKEFKGHYGNPIRLLRIRIRNRGLASDILRHVLASLPELERLELIASLELRISKGSLFIRLDKQRAFLGQVRLCEVDPIWMRAPLASSNVEDVRKALEEVAKGLESVL